MDMNTIGVIAVLLLAVSSGVLAIRSKKEKDKDDKKK